MSYLVFHFVFILPVIGLLAIAQPRPLAGVGGLRARWAIPLLCFIAFTYTTPWDNYLVARNVWWYGQDRVIATVGYVPVEEYMFFVLQPVLTGLALYQYLARWQVKIEPIRPGARRVGAALFFVLAVVGVGFLYTNWDPGLYLGLILAWSCPVLALMWVYGGPHLWALRSAVFWGVAPSTVYLWVADATAIHLGIWEISDAYSLGIDPLGLPVEEAMFFLVTNLLVVKGILLFIENDLLPNPTSSRNKLAPVSQID